MQNSRRPLSPDRDTISTRVIKSQDIDVEGARFRWWAVGQQPVLVTVRSEIFGSVAKFTYGDVPSFALALAKNVLAEHYAKAAELRRAEKKDAKEPADALKKTGWFGITD